MFEVTTVNLLNLIFISAGIGICGLCFLQITAAKHFQIKVRQYFQLFFLLIILYISFHLVRQLLEGQSGNYIHTILLIVTLFEMLSAGFMAFIMSILVVAVARIGKNEKYLQYLLIALISAHVVIMLVGFFKGSIFSFDDNNIYYREKQYILSNLIPLLMLVFDGIVINNFGSNIKPAVKRAFAIYIMAPVIAILIQSTLYGFQLIIFATVAAAVYMFLVITKDLNEKYEVQQNSAARIGAELRMATNIQASQLPRLFPAFPDRKEFDLYAMMIPAKEVGGDFYDFFLIDDDHLGLVMADVSGKGVPAALFMMITRVLIKTHLQNGESPEEALRNVNNQLCSSNEANLFVTVWIAVLEISTGNGVAINAGHEHPIIKRADSKYEAIEYKHFPAIATIESIPFKQHSFKLNPNDCIFIYTDGVTEATNGNHELFGMDRLVNGLNKKPDAMPKDVLSNVINEINDFVGNAEQFDDITMLCLYYNGK